MLRFRSQQHKTILPFRYIHTKRAPQETSRAYGVFDLPAFSLAKMVWCAAQAYKTAASLAV